MSGDGRQLCAVRGLAAAVLAVAAAACGGDFTSADEALGHEEAGDLATVMARQASRVFLAQVAEAPDPTIGVEISSQVLFDRGAACPRGGSAAVTGSVTRSSPADEDSMSLDFRASLVHDSCAVRLDGRSVDLEGDPAVRLEALFERLGDELAGPQETRLDGRVRWSDARGAAGSCEVDLTTTVRADRGTLRAAGRVCGFAVDRTVDISSPADGAGAPAVSGGDPGNERS